MPQRALHTNEAMNNEEEHKVVADLNDLVVNCSNLRELQSLIGQFNTFRVLGVEDMEIRHSNMLAWMLTPHESHGLQDHFLRRYLMHVSNETENEFLDPVEIDSVQIYGVDVMREWQNIDLLIDLETSDGRWLVVIENKVNSKQHSNQLKRYREIVEQAYPRHKKFYILLGKHSEEPDDEAYVCSSYELIHRALSSCVNEHRGSIGSEPGVLLKNYLTLLEQKFMENSRIEELAQKIYKSHKLAIDTIIEHRPVTKDTLSAFLQEKVSETNGLHLLSSNRSSLRFIPDEWNTPENRAGDAWGQNGAYILIEIDLGGSKTSLKIVSGRAPYDWTKATFEKTSAAPFTRGKRKLKDTPVWVTYDSIASKIIIKDLDPGDAELVNDKVWKWIEKTISHPDFQQRIDVVRSQIDELPKAVNF
jgi:hypothetical protein